MRKPSEMGASELESYINSNGAWGAWGSALEHRLYVVEANVKMRRRKCRCGCEKRITHMGAANGVGLYWGCEFSTHRWAKQGNQRRTP